MTTIMAFRLASVVTAIDVLVWCGFSIAAIIRPQVLALQEARRLMLVEAMDASAAAYHVGYFSRSQFTREYSRLFGAPPFRDVEQIRQQSQPAELRGLPAG